ncbi:glycosyl hydrolases family 35 domain-containing protein, putative [Babesia ovata]|uniref:Glycosyl hydrolases family 35 domain-containing protein, putative n=1 Tax=Babesia ovata TaxID=189622 RepID=A0A2H6KBL1_9APIC|nr:glycosyl hydrolases family 35 domain-containing protein, putative [Babesia ovata]GBE60375.1 glycosyl hydrolases family 35 domain-containing protein, putative [Babesia ovata]
MGPRSRRGGRDTEIFSKNASQLAHLVRVVSRKGSEDDHFWNQVTRRLIYIIDTISTKQLSYIANGLAKARVADPETWNSIVKRHYQLQKEYDVKDMVLMANALAKVKCVEHEVFQNIVHRIKDAGTTVPPRYIAVLVNSMAVAGYRDTTLVDSLLEQLNLEASQMSVVSIAILLDGLYNLRHRNRKVLACLAERLKNVLTHPKGEGVSRHNEAHIAATNSSDVSYRIRTHEYMSEVQNTSDKAMFEQDTDTTASHVSQNKATQEDDGSVTSTRISTQQLVLIHRAYSQFAFYDKKLFDLLFRQMEILRNKLKPLEIVMIANSMGKSKLHNKSIIELLCKKVIANKSGYTMDMITVFLHGICLPRDNNRGMRLQWKIWKHAEFFTQMFEAVIQNAFDGDINAKHCLTMLQIMTKV